MKLGCIGYGNMASAILGALIKRGQLAAENILVYEQMPKKAESITKAGMKTAGSIKEVGERCSVILIAVKPNNFADVLPELAPFNDGERVFISIAAGITVEKMEHYLGVTAPVVRAMPNTPILLGMGTTALCHNAHVTPERFTFAKSIFSSSGTVYDIPEAEFNDVINLNGSSPAFIYLFAKTIVEYTTTTSGISADVGLQMFCDTLKGSAEMMQRSGKTLDELIAMASSPGGTTVAALNTFKATGFKSSLQAGLAACVNRSIEMGKE